MSETKVCLANTEYDCSGHGGPSARRYESCFISGSDGTDDEFWLNDDKGKRFFTCTRRADDNEGCFDLLLAKEAYCKKR